MRERAFLFILLGGMALRIVWALLVPVEPVSDSFAYDQFARTLVEHGTYGWTADQPTAYWAVGTSALVAFTYLFTDSYGGVVILNLIAGAAVMVLTCRLATRWFDAATGLWSMALIAAWPNLIVFTTIVSSELFFIAMTLAGLIFWQRPRGNRVADLILAGILWGLAAYIRPVILLVPVTLALVELVRGPRRFATASLQAGICVALIVFVTLPWSLRNQQVFGERVMVSTNFGPNFWMGNNPDSNGGYMPLPAEVDGMGEVERSDYLKGLAKDYIRTDPVGALRLLGVKLVKLNGRETIGMVWNADGLRSLVGDGGITAAKLVATGYWYLLLLGGLVGIAVVARREGPVAAVFNPAVALWGYFVAVHVVIVAEDRYHMPASAFVAVMAAVALTGLSGSHRAGHPADPFRTDLAT